MSESEFIATVVILAILAGTAWVCLVLLFSPKDGAFRRQKKDADRG